MTSPFVFLVGALDDDAGRVAPIGIFHLRAEFAGAEIKLGADAGVTQRRDHLLVVGDAVLVEHGDDHRAGFGLGLDLAEMLQRGQQARHADGKSRRRHRLAAKARHKTIITPAAADRTEAR